MIEQTFIINLDIRPDRLKSIVLSLPESLKPYKVFSAVHGDSCPPPPWWHAGNGAWGCYRSHLQILEHCMTKSIHSYLVLEDDSVFVSDFDAKYEQFINKIPTDWDMFYLGGQLLHTEDHPPVMINEHVYKPFNVNRTHCFAVHSKAYVYLYQFLLRRFEQRNWHIDHHLGRLHEQEECNVYCPDEWLVGQGESSSNIDGRTHSTRFFPHPKTQWRVNLYQKPYCVLLFSSRKIAEQLREKHNWHNGYSLREDFVDKGLFNLNKFPVPKIRQWFAYIQRECMQDNKIPFLWLPDMNSIDWSIELPFHPIFIKSDSIEEIIECHKSEAQLLLG